VVTGRPGEELGSEHPTPSPCGSASTTAARAADAVRQLLTVLCSAIEDLIDLQQTDRSCALPAQLSSTPTKEASRHARAS
jgi:hypothetical protein